MSKPSAYTPDEWARMRSGGALRPAEYAPVGPESLERLWPEPGTRPHAAWTHGPCGLVVTNRADHEPLGNYPCPSPVPA